MRINEIAAAGSPKSKMIYHENPEMLHVNTLERHSYFIPFAKEQDPFAQREDSECFEMLNGDWNFRYFDSILDLEDDFLSVEVRRRFPYRPTGSYMDMTGHSIRMWHIRLCLIRRLFRTMIRSAFTAGTILI